MFGRALAAAASKRGFEVWPENWEPFCLFADLGSQWRSGMSGPTGLDYTAVLALMGLMDITREEQRDLFNDIRVMEQAALSEMQGSPDGN